MSLVSAVTELLEGAALVMDCTAGEDRSEDCGVAWMLRELRLRNLVTGDCNDCRG